MLCILLDCRGLRNVCYANSRMGAMPKVVDHDARRAELVDAAWRVIAAEGLEAATMRRIAQAAGCTTGRVTHYFYSKDDMLVAALREVHRRAAERMIRHIGRADA